MRAIEWDQSHNNPSYLLEGDDLSFAEQWLAGSVGKRPEPTEGHHVYIKASRVGADVRAAREAARENLARQSRRAAIVLGVVGAVAVLATLAAIPISINAVNSNDHAIVVVASAGSGKTEVAAQRVERLLSQDPNVAFRILAISYTVKAADEPLSLSTSTVHTLTKTQ